MVIEYECVCGARISMPEAAAGRRARCRSCGLIARVPEPQWQIEAAIGINPSSEDRSLGAMPDHPPVTRNGTVLPPVARRRPASTDNSTSGGRSFWVDAIGSFTFFCHGSNLAILVTITMIQLALLFLGSIPIANLLTWLIGPLFGMWLSAFALNVVTETAQGDDVLSAPGATDPFDDLLRPSLQFIGCWLLAMGPAVLIALMAATWGGGVPWHLVGVLGGIGLFFLPVLILGTAIGGELPLRSIPLLIRTVLGTLGPYLSVCMMVGLAALVAVSSINGMGKLVTTLFGTSVPLPVTLIVIALGELIEVCAWIVAMRQIGLYYRHFKSSFPWQAE